MSRPRIAALVPVFDAGGGLTAVLEALRRELGPGPRIVTVDDGSRDGSRDVLDSRARDLGLVVVDGPGRGAAAALNEGLRHLDEDLVAQIDQDVLLRSGWIENLLRQLEDTGVAAAQARYVSPGDAPLPARVDTLDLAFRWDALEGGESDHVATGNTLYRVEAVRSVGGFDEGLGYGYDNDLSYRLRRAGWRLVVDADAIAEHRGRDSWSSWFAAQCGQGRGRLDLVARHPDRVLGDRVSGPGMILRVPIAGLATTLMGLSWGVTAPRMRKHLRRTALGLFAGLAVQSLRRGLAASPGDLSTALAFPAVHAARDVAWCTTAVHWLVHRAVGRASRPEDSMRRGIPDSNVSAD